MRKYSNFEYKEDLIEEAPLPDTRLIAVVPSYMEEYLEGTLESILRADPPNQGSVEVLVVINESETAIEDIIRFHDQQYQSLLEWKSINQTDKIRFHIIRARSLPQKHAGVGLARKIGMDEAVKRFAALELTDGIISSLDADVRISRNYFHAVLHAFAMDPELRAASVYFEHFMEENADDAVRKSIIDYELHLRYHINMQRVLQLPYAFHTVGSTMAVRASAYLAHFGMNKRQAGEDFYFLHKFIKTGYYTEINDAIVFPSSRFSERVPFGTGRAVQKNSIQSGTMKTYHFKSYKLLQHLTGSLRDFYGGLSIWDSSLPDPLTDYFGEVLNNRVEEARYHTDAFSSFVKRFYSWFDAFQLIKYLHHMRSHHFPDIPISDGIEHLFTILELPFTGHAEINLETLRKYDRKGWGAN